VGFGRYYPLFWIGLPHDGKPATPGNGVHVALNAASTQQVDEFHRVALENGAVCDGKPGPRPQYHAGYYGAFVRDKDGNKIEACFVDLGIWNYCAIQ
jgi:predicted lactoylglutathione lyase